MPKGTKTLGNNKARAWESLGFEHKKRGCARFDTPSFIFPFLSTNNPIIYSLALAIEVDANFHYRQSAQGEA